MTLQKFIWYHCKIDVFVPTSAKVEHFAGGVEAEHGVFMFELLFALLKIHFEAEMVVGVGIRENWGESNTVGNCKMVIQHRLCSIHADLSCANFKAEIIVDLNFVTMVK